MKPILAIAIVGIAVSTCPIVDAANFKIIPLGAIHHIKMASDSTPKSEVWEARALLFDEYSGETFYCGLAIRASLPKIRSDQKPVCSRAISVMQPGVQFDASAATSLLPSEQISATEKITYWYPSPLWMIQKTNLSTLQLCEFSPPHISCTFGVIVK